MKTKLKNLTIIIISFFFLSQKSAAQLEIGFGTGASLYFGDLGGSPNSAAYHIWDLDYQSIRGIGQAFIRMPINDNSKFKLNFALIFKDGAARWWETTPFSSAWPISRSKPRPSKGTIIASYADEVILLFLP